MVTLTGIEVTLLFLSRKKDSRLISFLVYIQRGLSARGRMVASLLLNEEGGMSNDVGRLVFSRDPSRTLTDGIVFGTSGGGENADLEVLCALPYELVRPHAGAPVLASAVGVGTVKKLSLSVKYLDGEISVGRYDRVSGFLVEQARALVGGDAEYQLSAVLCREGVAERLDLESDAFAPMLSDDRDPFDDGCMLGEDLAYLCGMDPARPGVEYERFGYVKGWLEEGRAYQTVLSPYAYVRRPDRSVIVSDDCWNALVEVFDVPDEQALDCLCLGVRCGGAWPVDGGEVVRWSDRIVFFSFLVKNARSRCWNVGDGRCNQYSEPSRVLYLAGSWSVAAQCIVWSSDHT